MTLVSQILEVKDGLTNLLCVNIPNLNYFGVSTVEPYISSK